MQFVEVYYDLHYSMIPLHKNSYILLKTDIPDLLASLTTHANIKSQSSRIHQAFTLCI